MPVSGSEACAVPLNEFVCQIIVARHRRSAVAETRRRVGRCPGKRGVVYVGIGIFLDAERDVGGLWTIEAVGAEFAVLEIYDRRQSDAAAAQTKNLERNFIPRRRVLPCTIRLLDEIGYALIQGHRPSPELTG